MFKNALFEDLLVLKRFEKHWCKTHGLAKHCSQCMKVLRTGCPVCWVANVCGRTGWSCNMDSST